MQTQHRVAPRLFICSLYITQRDVHTSNITCQTVDDDNLTVVTVVHLARKCGEMHGQEGLHFDASFSHPLEKAVRNTPTTHIIINDAHLDTLAGLVNQHIGQEVAQWVLFEDVHGDMDVMLRTSDVGQQFRKETVAVGHNVDSSHFKGQRKILIDEEIDELLMTICYMQVLLFDETQHGTFRQLVE